MIPRRYLRAVTLLGTALAVPSVSIPASAASFGDEAQVRVANAANEQYERDVDEVALASQTKAITRLTGLLKKYRGTSQEPVLLSKLADLQQQNAAILFRLSHGKKASDMSRYKTGMKQAIDTFSTLIAKYPHFEEISRAYFGRGKGYEEIGEQEKATKDYLHLVKNFSDAEEAVSAYMSLAEFAILGNDHAKAISYLNEVERHPESPQYPFALYKLAWSHYNLKNIATALSFAERQIAYYNARIPEDAKADATMTSDAALRDNTLMDVAVFYFEGYEQKVPQYALSNALPYFKKIESGSSLGKMIVRFSKLLRAHGHETDLMSWKDQILLSESDRPESLDVLTITYEFQMNKRRYTQLVESAQDMVKLYQRGKRYEGFTRAQKLVLDTADSLQAAILKNKSADDVRSYSAMLATLYDSFTRMVDEKDARIPRVHYNLAETLFAIKDYAGATEHYRWVVEHADRKTAGSLDAGLKAVAARYEVLRQKQLIPQDLQPRAIPKSDPDKLEPLLAQWVDWLDEHVKKSEKSDAENFLFESNRALYARGQVTRAVERFQEFVKKHPKSQYAAPSASLVLDTYMATEDWDATHELALKYLKSPEWKTGDFSKKLTVIAGDAFYKRLESFHKAKDYKSTLKAVDEFLKRYPDSARISDALSVAGAASLASSDKSRASSYFTRLIEESRKGSAGSKGISPANVSAALLARAGLSEERYLFSTAAADYKAFLMLPTLPTSGLKIEESKADDLRKKTLILAWLSGDPAELRAALETKVICTESLAAECEKYEALSILASPERAREESMTEAAFDKARKSGGTKETRTLWAAIALEGARHLAFRDRHVAIRAVTAGWEDLEPLVRFTVLPYLTVSIPKTFELNRMAMRDVAPLRADERYITRRVEVIREMENAATKAMKLPWSRIRAETLNQIASAYLDFARGLTDLKTPKDLNEAEVASYQETVRKLALPFEEKGQEMRFKAFEIASNFAIDEQSFQAISEPFFAENPSQAKKLKPAVQIHAPAALGLATLELLDSDGEWKAVAKAAGKPMETENAALYLKSLWSSALQAKRWQQLAYFMQEASEKKLIPSGPLGALKAVSLAAAGARGEALAELQDSRGDLKPDSKLAAAGILMHHFLRACAKEKTLKLYKEIESDLAARKEKASKELASIQTAAKSFTQ